MSRLLFGPAGVPESVPEPKTSVRGIERVAELGLECMELEFVRGVHMGEKAALEVRDAARRLNVSLTAHAPYFINLNAAEPAKIAASQQRILQTARIAALCGAESMVFHAGFYLGQPPSAVYDVIRRNLLPVLEQLDKEGNRLWVRPEVTGKHTQFGDLEEVLRLSRELPRVAPCIDFAHWHARTLSCNSYGDFSSMIKHMAEVIGPESLAELHVHVSGIKYSKAGELKHLNLKESDFRYDELLRAMRDHRVGGTVICESPNLEGDAMLLQKSYSLLSREPRPPASQRVN